MAKTGIYKSFVEKKLLFLLNGGKKKEQEKVIHYLKMYTNLIAAEYNLSKPRGFDHLRVVRNISKEAHTQSEAHYLEYLSNIVKEVLANKEKILDLLKTDPSVDPYYAKTRLLMAQNICVMRILKLAAV